MLLFFRVKLCQNLQCTWYSFKITGNYVIGMKPASTSTTFVLSTIFHCLSGSVGGLNGHNTRSFTTHVLSQHTFFIYGHSCSPTYPLLFENHKSLLRVCCTLSMEWTPHWSPWASSDTVSCTFTYHTWQFIIFTIFTITTCIFSYSLSVSFWTQDLALQQILSSIDLFLYYRTDYTDSRTITLLLCSTVVLV